jgi:hypothetical protein
MQDVTNPVSLPSFHCLPGREEPTKGNKFRAAKLPIQGWWSSFISIGIHSVAIVDTRAFVS